MIVLRVVLAALAVQVLLLVGVAVALVVTLLGQDDRPLAPGLATAAFALAFAALLAAATRGLHRGQRWARAPVVTVQLLALAALAVPMLTAGPVWAGVLVTVLALVVAVGVFTRPVVEHTTGADDAPTV